MEPIWPLGLLTSSVLVTNPSFCAYENNYAYPERKMLAYIFIALTILFWGAAPLFDKIALKNAHPLAGLFIRSVAVFISIMGVFFLKGINKILVSTPLRSIIFFAASGILAGLLGMFTYYGALKTLPASKVVPLCSTYPMVAAVLALIFLGEQITVLRLLGIVLIILGIWLVK